MTTGRYDVAVLGGGFAGGLAACCLAAAGRSVALVDRGRAKLVIGESGTPAAGQALRRIAERFDLPWLAPLTRHGELVEQYPHLRAGRKRGFSYFRHAPGEAFEPGIGHANEVLVLANRTAAKSDVHWDRGNLDALLTARAADGGATLYEDAAVTSVAAARRGGYELRGERGGEPLDLRADFLLDAGGPGGILRPFLGLPDRTGALKTRTRAVYLHLDGLPDWDEVYDAAGRRGHPFPAGEAAVHHVLPKTAGAPAGWVWELRFDDGRTSVGRVAPVDEDWRYDPADPLAVAGFPTLRRRYRRGRCAAPKGGPVRTGRVQRRTGRVAGADYALLPTAAGFIDPLHSTGLAHAAAGVLRCCSVLEEHWGRPGLGRELTEYAAAVDRELDRVDGLVAPCYAALNDWPTFTLALVLYKAAATCGERSAGGGEFLIAGDMKFSAVAAEFSRRAGREPAGSLRRWLRRALGPWDAAGLFDPAVPNMHVRTAAPDEP